MATLASKSQYRWQNAPQAPICRVHVYSADQKAMRAGDYLSSARPVTHWAGPDNVTKVVPPEQRPFAIVGREGVYIKDYEDSVLPTPQPHKWEILNARVVLTRHWNCSSFSFQVAHPVTPGFMPREKMVPPIQPNDVVVIEMGYMSVLYPSAKLADGRTNWYSKANVNGRVQGDVVLVGVVDSVVERAGSGEADGIVYTIKGRDQMRWLADQKFRAHYAPGFQGELNRAFVVRDMLFQATMIDEVKFKLPEGGRGRSGVSPEGQVVRRVPESMQDQVATEGGAASSYVPTPAQAGANNSYIRLGMIEYSSRVDAPPEGRAENQTPTQMLIMDKFPLQVIKHYSLVETAPRELWADPKTGAIHWMNRRTDARRLYSSDPEIASTRQYFYRWPESRVNVLSATNEWSVAGVVTHFTIFNPNTSAGDVSAPQIYAESPTATLRNPHFNERYLRPMTRGRFVFDDTLREGADTAVAVLGALFNIWGRAIQTGMVMIPGDPTLEIGEAVQLFNMGLFARLSHDGSADSNQTDVFATNGVNADGSPASGSQAGYADVDKNPEGVHRVEAVQHLFAVGGAHRGYTTVFVYGPVDEDTGQGGGFTEKGYAEAEQAAATTAPRLIKTDEDFAKIASGCLAGLALQQAREVNTDQIPTLANTGAPSNGTEPPGAEPKPEQKPPTATGAPAAQANASGQPKPATPQQK